MKQQKEIYFNMMSGHGYVRNIEKICKTAICIFFAGLFVIHFYFN